MNLDELIKHEIIAVDFDGTLIEHPRSAVLQQFVLDHQGKRNFHIVTFRSHGMENKLAVDLYHSTQVTKVPLRLEHFVGIHAIPYDLFANHILLSQHDSYFSWKAEKCKEIGCTVLVDDMIDNIVKHCEIHGIIGLNPDHF